MMRIADEHVWKANMMIGSKPTAVFAAIIVLFINTPILSLFAGRQDQGSSSADLNAILAKAAEYADRLERAALDFVCCEEIKEWLDPTLDAKLELSRGRTDYDPITGEFKTWQGAKEIKKSYVYDYQCIRKQGKIHETRTLLKENGKEKKEAKASLKTLYFDTARACWVLSACLVHASNRDINTRLSGKKRSKGRRSLLLMPIH
ncbi:MAG TPA: hypothetical protein HA348_02970 [Thermoplasmata archaeon]|nr:hypothetical protein [Thermoplasmata archaeon]